MPTTSGQRKTGTERGTSKPEARTIGESPTIPALEESAPPAHPVRDPYLIGSGTNAEVHRAADEDVEHPDDGVTSTPRGRVTGDASVP